MVQVCVEERHGLCQKLDAEDGTASKERKAKKKFMNAVREDMQVDGMTRHKTG